MGYVDLDEVRRAGAMAEAEAEADRRAAREAEMAQEPTTLLAEHRVLTGLASLLARFIGKDQPSTLSHP